MMGVVKDVLLAEAVVAGAFGAVTELQVRMLRIRAAAHLALVVVPLLPLLFPHGLAELDRLWPSAAMILSAPRPKSGAKKMKKFKIATSGRRAMPQYPATA